MSQPETPVMTDIDRLILAQEETQRRLDVQTEALNNLGANVQWIIDNAKGIFEMFSNPAFMGQMMGQMGGMGDGN